MQILLVLGRLMFVALIYLFLLRVLTALLGDLQAKGVFHRRDLESGQLEVLSGTDTLPKGRRFRIDDKGLKMGRGKNNDVIVPDHFVSIEHALFRRHKGVTLVEDMGSTNGTWVNGERIDSPVQLVIGDYVKIGSITFQYTRWQNENSKL